MSQKTINSDWRILFIPELISTYKSSSHWKGIKDGNSKFSVKWLKLPI